MAPKKTTGQEAPLTELAPWVPVLALALCHATVLAKSFQFPVPSFFQNFNSSSYILRKSKKILFTDDALIHILIREALYSEISDGNEGKVHGFY